MLTKDLVQATARSGKLFPKIYKTDDVEALSDARELCALFRNAKGRVLGDVEEDIKANCSTPRRKAFAKLLLDRCQMADSDESIMELRWKAFKVSESLRRESPQDFETFAENLAVACGAELEELRDRLFSDLPSARLISEFEPIADNLLLETFNLAQVKTILCLAEAVEVSFSDCASSQKREIMRQVKFHRLLATIKGDCPAGVFCLSLGGPLNIFGKTPGYALRLANFFSFVAAMPKWRLEATIKWKNKLLRLCLDEQSGVRCKSTRALGAYVPPEFSAILTDSGSQSEFCIAPGEDFINLGKENYCFPDFVVKVKKRSFSLELFHGGHQAQLKQRVEAATKSNLTNLIVGVDRSVLKDKGTAKICEESSWFQNFGFEFNQFPTLSAVKKAVSRHV